jgi:hypothetical protein
MVPFEKCAFGNDVDRSRAGEFAPVGIPPMRPALERSAALLLIAMSRRAVRCGSERRAKSQKGLLA